MIQNQFYCSCVLRSDVRHDTVTVHTNDVIEDAADSRVAARSLRRSNRELFALRVTSQLHELFNHIRV